MATPRDMLAECVLRGYFILKCAFVRLDSTPIAAANTMTPFYQALAIFSTACKALVQERPEDKPRGRRLERIAREALCAVAGLGPRDPLAGGKTH